jgi:dihydrofolate synthase/folylpolyglutamate synthase
VNFKTLAEWLDYQQRIHPRAIELGLERVREVWRRMGAPAPAPIVVTIGGTNGKGSTVAFLEAMLGAAGKRVGAYTSPHLLRYNERVRVLGEQAGDVALVDAFERIETARSEIPLTYFEFGTLAALWIFAQSKLDIALLEVGLGGRLDAVNIIDADAAIVTTVDFDHQDWLGNDIDSIAREKAGIFRSDRPAIIGMHEPPTGLLSEGERIGPRLVRAGRDYQVEPRTDGWQWQCGSDGLDLPYPSLAAPCQIDNAAAALAALYALRDRLGWSPQALGDGVRGAHASARLQRFAKPGAAELVIDVAHNPQAARTLGTWLGQHPVPTLAVFGALSDKDVGGIAEPLGVHVDHWFLAGLQDDTPRGLTAMQVRERMPAAAGVSEFADVGSALDAALARAQAQDRIIAFGSFFVAASALAWARNNGYFTA